MSFLLNKFPEDLFPCNSKEYLDKVERGFNFAKGKSVLVCGLARDCERELFWNIHRWEFFLKFFADYRVFLYENDSSDRTPELLDKWSRKNSRIDFLSEKLKKDRHEQVRSFSRTKDMAYYRNKYVNHIKEYGKNYEYIIIYDFDLKGGFSYEGIFNSLYHMETNKSYDVIGSNGLYYDDAKTRLYFDIWASRGSLFEDTGNLLKLDRGQPPIKVESCGGGLLIYKNSVWCPSLEYKPGDCDHPTLHKQMNANIYINPSQITLYNEHRYCL